MTPKQESQVRSITVTIGTVAIMLVITLPVVGLAVRMFRWAAGW